MKFHTNLNVNFFLIDFKKKFKRQANEHNELQYTSIAFNINIFQLMFKNKIIYVKCSVNVEFIRGYIH